MGLMLKLKPAPFIFILSAFLLGISFYWSLTGDLEMEGEA